MQHVLIPMLLLLSPAPELGEHPPRDPGAIAQALNGPGAIAQAPDDKKPLPPKGGDKNPLPLPPKKPAPPPEPPDGDKGKPDAKKKSPISCEVITKEAPRGGRLEVRGTLGDNPLIKIAGRFTRIIERRGDVIAVQIHRDSNGGAVTLKSGKHEADCGTLTIIGRN